jgi:hypothetical protein
MGSKAMSIVGVVTALLWLQVARTYYSSDGIENDVLALVVGILGGSLAYARGLGALGWGFGAAMLPPTMLYVIVSPSIGARARIAP